MLHHATAGSFLGISGVVWFWVLTILGVGAVVLSLSRRYQLLRSGRPDNRFDRLGERFQHMLVYAFGQKKMFDDPLAGFYHLLIFYGFLAVSLRTLTMVLEGLFAGWELPLLHTPVGNAYLFSKDVFEFLVLIGLAFAVWRRGIQKKDRVIQSWGAWLVIAFIAILMVTDLASEGARIAAGDIEGSYLPISSIVAGLFSNLETASLQTIYGWSWWIHLITLFVFANELPYSKHFHVYTALFNSFFANLQAPGKLPGMDLEDIDEDTTFGISTVTDFTWKQMLDMYTCTECGRCREFCPTTLTHKPLQPVLFLKAVRDQLYSEQSAILGAPGDGSHQSENELVPAIVDPEVIWACTTCRWCERACPLDITYVDKLVEMRRNLVLEKAEFPEEAQPAFRGYEVNGNPWQLPPEERGNWAQGLEVPLASEAGGDFEYLFFVGSPGSYDDHGKKVSEALVKILRKAGVKIAILGPEEASTGDAPRRLGNEYLFQVLAQQNIETMNGYGIKKIVTNCPHAFNTLAHEYPEFGGDYEVVHGTQLVAELVRAGRVKLTGNLDIDLAFHDPCYLGRTNGEYDAPRFLLNAIPGVRVREAELNRERSMCCGAGGGRMWLEEKIGERINQTRFSQLEASGTSEVAVACPYCFSMLSDAQNELGRESVSTYDVIELVAKSLDG
ncbi:MAG: 4Fe-4S dicluster domain-containing protein [Acidobacteria bacterium]|jgi:Fe-S oxidoreductase|nr:4Fe-4S dicluster domain-containing protein [Acidobacteriota bacterium]